METCEICGKSTEKIYLARVEEAQMWVCTSCSKGKTILKGMNLQEVEKGNAYSRKKMEEEDEIVDHFGEQIRKAREKLGFPLKVLAERISEQESTLRRVEQGRGLPTDTLRKKLEKELGIKLAVKKIGDESTEGFGRKQAFTLGDVAFKKGGEADKEEE
ncbi:MAG TPA: multiprotein bridging factor aMBF1 [Candidatus Aquilonibacter sp.]|nr:multiprotein bridging factor aMBF1 [Candidatus Aquilonibacter sp.]